MRMPFSPCPMDGSACSDVSVEILSQVFGPVVHKLAMGRAVGDITSAGNTLASMMEIFNGGIIVEGGLLVSAIVAGSVMNTANDGEIMGKHWSTPNTILRLVAGGAMLLPTSAGYSIIQMLVMTITLWAVGLANTVYEKGVEVGILNGNLTVTSAQMGITDKAVNDSYALADFRIFSEGLTRSIYCAHVANSTYVMASGQRPAVQTDAEPDAVIEETGRTGRHFKFADRNASTNLAGGNAVCGSVTLYDFKADPKGTLRDDASSLQALRLAIFRAKSQAMLSMIPALQRWIATWPSSIDQQGHETIQSNTLNEIVRNAENKFQAELANNVRSDDTLQRIMSAYVKSVTNEGWMYAGGFYQKIGEIRGEVSKMMVEQVATSSGPNLNDLPKSAQSRAVINSVSAVPAIVASRALERRTTVSPSDVAAVIHNGLNVEGGIDSIGPKAEGIMSAWVNNSMKGVLATLLGTSGDVDAIARIKATGDVMAVMAAIGVVIDKSIYTGLSAARAVAATGGAIQIFGSGVNLEPAARSVLDWATYVFLKPLAELVNSLNTLAFYFGVFLPTLPYTIFVVACVGFLLQVLQTFVAAPLWAVMHMPPERTFIGSQTQGYLLLLSLFIRPSLMILGLFSAFLLINPILGGVTEAFFAMRSAVNSDSFWLVQFFQLKNWLIVYGFLLAPIMFMVFGLSQALPDAVLQWLNIGTSNLGHTQATSEMRSQTEKYGPTPASIGGPGPRPLPGAQGRPFGNPNSRPRDGRNSSGTSASLPLLSANGQGVTPSNNNNTR